MVVIPAAGYLWNRLQWLEAEDKRSGRGFAIAIAA